MAKKTGKPRRTIDFQPLNGYMEKQPILNTYAAREAKATKYRHIPNFDESSVCFSWLLYID